MANIHDVSKAAGVSVSTVSRVLNNHPYVKKEKVEAVKKAIIETGYIPNINAVNLKKGKTHLIGIVLPFLDVPYFSQLVQGISQAASVHQYKLVLYQTGYDEHQEKEALEMLKLKQIDSLIICSRKISLETVEHYQQYGSIVLFENGEDTPLSYTFIDHYACFMRALEYLYEHGHRKIGFSVNRLEGANSSQRERAYRDFLKLKGLPFHKDYIFKKCLNIEDGERILREIAAFQERPTAILATSDQVAAGIITSSSNYELKVPRDLAVIGFDDQPIARAMQITSVNIPLYSIGQILFEQAIAVEISHKEVSTELMERSTV
ncbi:LacI family transcriptional regulator [Oceanobacillus oncorhynchi subsp. incaldanensis]|uniref:Catabolite control protein B n=1 Tax=Oceanobacillus oncorhynchi TaxID=545501 RepID=A0A0A1MBX0_9BACI|nr:substrate-binding domain-containing protein [Oceanobacillus oncorhynchi]GIO17437.1 LacI family transcriptional regulator [Oceanobacillus oncorhynchi subsp. incaldanensis]CEI82820.1 Catabolite control protein B [Oceanobacillus oncorhynchi]